MFNGLAQRFDAWANAVTGLGTSIDKVQAYVFARYGRTDDETLEAMYEEDDLAANIVEAVPEHMMRRGFNIEVDGEPDTGPAMVKWLMALGVTKHITDAMVWENVFGGAIVVLGLNDGQDVSLPLDEENIDNILFVNALDRRDIIPVYWYSDPTGGDYGRPSVYRITYLAQGMEQPLPGGKAPPFKPHTLEVHESRLLVFGGMRTTFRSRIRYNGWGVPMLSRLRIPLRTFHGNWQSVENMMSDASQGVYKLAGLMQALTSGSEEYVMTRMRLLDRTRSVARAIVVDKDGEDFDRKDTSMSGLPELLDRTAQRLAAAAKMPVTRLMGVSPAGLNATGEADLRGWYDNLEARREQDLKPLIERLVLLAFKSRRGPTNGRVPDKWEVEFDSLWQESALEMAQADLAESQADATRITSGVASAEEIAILRAEKLGIDTGSRDEALKAYESQLAAGDEDMPPTPMATPVPGLQAPVRAPAGASTPNPTPAPPKAPTEPVEPDAKDPSTALNGAQIASLLEIVTAVATRQVPRDTGVALITSAFPLDEAEANKILGEVGRTFFVTTDAPSGPSVP